MEREGFSTTPSEYKELATCVQESFGLTEAEFQLLEFLAREPFQRSVTFKRVAEQLKTQPHSVQNFASRLRLKLHKGGVLPQTHNDTEALIQFYQDVRTSIR